jgi:hypothetical protein
MTGVYTTKRALLNNGRSEKMYSRPISRRIYPFLEAEGFEVLKSLEKGGCDPQGEALP